ncbi:hypothetical protein H0H81_002891 [Sphagnurus paluster]|uniref:Major facilitator superfamily (MFS) profile domain-containing protein n=1 Tax=Sphagnurus paluster TaxID=117069 RepID=A0A9P7GLQ4_9AGAR|nr:hypothetical protein H0H81_002891 [Sphagnurus paluster]
MSQVSTIELVELPRDISGRKHVADETIAGSTSANVKSTSGSVDNTQAPARSRDQIRKGRVQFVALCWTLFIAGWNDGTLGPLLPRIQNVYHVVAYTMQAPALPFPAFVVSYAINGLGIALQDAQANGFVASLKDNAEAKMGILHAVYGAGALCAPLVATQFAQMRHWSFHFLISLGLSISNTLFLLAVFRFKDQDECLRQAGETVSEQEDATSSKFRVILSHRTVHLLAFFILVYVGVEVTIGGWIVTFIIEERKGGPSSGYISAGFFGGLMLGRVALLWVNKKIGERLAVFLYALLAISLELVVWLVPSLIGNAVAVSLVGLLLGPMYPIAISHAGRVLPRWILTGAIGWIAGFGQAGSAVLPFLTGSLAAKFGIKSLQPL